MGGQKAADLVVTRSRRDGVDYDANWHGQAREAAGDNPMARAPYATVENASVCGSIRSPGPVFAGQQGVMSGMPRRQPPAVQASLAQRRLQDTQCEVVWAKSKLSFSALSATYKLEARALRLRCQK